MQARIIFSWLAVSAIVCLPMSEGLNAQQTSKFPDMIGVWVGEYAVAFAKSHSNYADQSAVMEMELDVYRQENNLVWAHNRWRPVGTDRWHVEETTGTFKLEDPNELYLTERAPVPIDWGSTGILHGSIIGETLYVTYQGIGNGISFAVALERRDN